MSSSAFPPRASSLSPPRVSRPQQPAPPPALNISIFPALSQTSSPVRRKPLPPTPLSPSQAVNQIGSGGPQHVNRRRAETLPIQKDGGDPRKVVRNSKNLDRYAYSITVHQPKFYYKQESNIADTNFMFFPQISSAIAAESLSSSTTYTRPIGRSITSP